jgi:hypothetical protein
MTRLAGRIADRVLSLVAPSLTATAAMQTQCFQCGASTRSKLCRRDCVQGVCEPWSCGNCYSC